MRRVVDDAFGAELVASPVYPHVASMTVQFLRGLAISDVLRGERETADRLARCWATVVRAIFNDTPLGTQLSELWTTRGRT